MGGKRALDRLRFITFDFVIEVDGKETARRSHMWDREAGQARVQGELPDGRSVIAVLDLKQKTGYLYLGIQPDMVESNDAELLRQCALWHAQAAWWLFGPTQLGEEGVRARVEPPVEIDSISLPTVAVTFDPGYGPLAGDQYWFHVDSKTHLPYASSFMLGDELTAQTTVLWKQWVTLHGFQLPTRFVIVRSRRIIGIDKLAAPDWIEMEAFISPVLPVVLEEEPEGAADEAVHPNNAQ